jgi:phage tail protein X
MARSYTTVDGDMIDMICYRFYDGKQSGVVEAVLDANYAARLSEQPAILPRGIKIVLPDLPSTLSKTPLVKLWD